MSDRIKELEAQIASASKELNTLRRAAERELMNNHGRCFKYRTRPMGPWNYAKVVGEHYGDGGLEGAMMLALVNNPFGDVDQCTIGEMVHYKATKESLGVESEVISSGEYETRVRHRVDEILRAMFKPIAT